ncbi:BTAD domain-containing putative transcriptional regulator [Nocardia sp. NPDC101769]|uniref:AfsR/SARP family transcriptional regulator n=1 Tax=Nocardia sp. NPDC101769 TaxID=3364333 RepID=UPI003814C2F4
MIEFSILGPLDISKDGVSVRIGGYLHRAVIGYLLVNANSVVSISRLVNSVWMGKPPRTARKMIHNAVSDIRRHLENLDPDGTVSLVTQQPGYALLVPLETIDLQTFCTMERAARTALNGGQVEFAHEQLRAALALWRGRALADLTENGAKWPELMAVENRRLAACEEYFDIELARGCHHDVAAELEVLLAEAPTRERLGQQYMLALYRSGRQIEALEFYRRTRERLIDTLGIVPGVEMERQYELILNHDPCLQIGGGTAVA